MPRNAIPLGLAALLTLTLVVVALGCSASANAEGEFTLSSDPDDVVLSVVMTPAMRGYRTTMTLYGDGRMAILKKYASGKVVEDRELRLDLHEMTAILRNAVDSGLMEYDTEEMGKRQEQKHGGRFAAPDHTHIEITISLEDYSRGSGEPEDVTNKITTAGVRQQSELYGFPEYQGILDLLQAMADVDSRTPAEAL